MALHHNLLHPLRPRLFSRLHTGSGSHRSLVHETTGCGDRPGDNRWVNWWHHLPLDAATPLPTRRLQMGNANLSLHLPLPPQHRQPPHTHTFDSPRPSEKR